MTRSPTAQPLAAERKLSLGQLAGSAEAFAGEGVECLAGGVVADDHHGAVGAVGVAQFGPAIDGRAQRVCAGGVQGDVLGLVREVGLRIAVMEGGEGGALGRVSLAHDLQQRRALRDRGPGRRTSRRPRRS